MVKLPFCSSILAVSALCTQGAELGQKVIGTVEIRGATAMIPMQTRAGEPLNDAKVQQDVKALWRSGRFSDVRVEAVDNDRTVNIVFRIREKPVVRLRKIEVTPLTPGISVGIEPNAAVDALRSQEVASGIRKQLESSGYPDAKVEAKLLPAGPGWTDMQVVVNKGRNIRITKVTLSGELGVKPAAAYKALRSTKKKTMLPGIPGIWKGWSLLADYSEGAVQGDIANLRSFYFKNGYFDAKINRNELDITGRDATIDFGVHSGAPYAIHEFSLFGANGVRRIAPESDGKFPAQNACTALLAERRLAEKAGVLDFNAKIEVDEGPGVQQLGGAAATKKWADLTATVHWGPAYHVGRIEFRGNHTYSDLIVRRMFLLSEGDPLDELLLRKSLTRLNRTGFFEPLAETDVVVNTAPGTDRADLTIWLKERKARRWYLSGPVGPMSVGGPLRFSIGSRLPAWGQGILELASYTASLNLVYFAKPLSTILPIFPNKRFLPELTINRPLLPGQSFSSGFVLAPQFGWKGMLAGYAISHGHDVLGNLLESERAYTPVLPVTIAHKGVDTPPPGAEEKMFCELPKTKGEWGRQIGGISVHLVFSFMPF